MVSEDEEVGMDFFKTAYVMTREGSTPTVNEFDGSKCDGEWLQIGGFLKTMTPDAAWKKKEANRIRKKAYRFFLRCRVIMRMHGEGRDHGGLGPRNNGDGGGQRSNGGACTCTRM